MTAVTPDLLTLSRLRPLSVDMIHFVELPERAAHTTGEQAHFFFLHLAAFSSLPHD